MFETTFLLNIADFLDRWKEKGASLTSWVPPGVWSFPPRTYLDLPLGQALRKTGIGTGRMQVIEVDGELATCVTCCFNKFDSKERDKEE